MVVRVERDSSSSFDESDDTDSEGGDISDSDSDVPGEDQLHFLIVFVVG